MMALLNDITSGFRSVGLPVPPIPPALRESLTRHSDWVWSTATLPARLFELDSFVQRAIVDIDAPSLSVGHDGYGTNNWSMHYYLVRRDVAIFLQEPWGGAFTDRGQAGRNLRRHFDSVQQVLDRCDCRSVSEQESSGRLIVVRSSTSGSRRAWVKDSEEITWIEAPGDVLAAALADPQL